MNYIICMDSQLFVSLLHSSKFCPENLTFSIPQVFTTPPLIRRITISNLHTLSSGWKETHTFLQCHIHECAYSKVYERVEWKPKYTVSSILSSSCVWFTLTIHLRPHGMGCIFSRSYPLSSCASPAADLFCVFM